MRSCRTRSAWGFAVLLAILGCGADKTVAPPSDSGWTKDPGNPVLSRGPAGSWDGTEVGTPCVLDRGGSFTMWYTGCDSSTSQIGLATSADGRTWTRHAGNPVFGPGPPGSWDGLGVEDPCVIPDGTTFRMYYTGRGAAPRSIGLATSGDGVHWTRSDANPVLVPTPVHPAWDDEEVFTPWIRRDGASFKMWFGATGTSSLATGYATSDDGVFWTKLLVPVLDAQVLESPNYAPCVLGGGDNFRIWYVARHEYIGGFRPGAIDYAQSRDGIEWTSHRTVLLPGGAGAWDDGALRAVCVLEVGSGLRMWYEGHGAPAAGGSTSGFGAIGLATHD